MIDLLDLVRSIAANAARAEEGEKYSNPCAPGSQVLARARQACVERGHAADVPARSAP
ncbi:hypothetical protein [Janthinobacterium sp. RB2P8]|uniref:hypothetical protein n=1 Tax=Janthinobacterium sp. RB2P8 TaxID=3424191 RepID=UPI003F289E57